jgi:hypothetical protein
MVITSWELGFSLVDMTPWEPAIVLCRYAVPEPEVVLENMAT